MNRTTLSQQINGELIERLKNNPVAFSSFLQNQNDGTIIYVLEKLGRLNELNKYGNLFNQVGKPKFVSLQEFITLSGRIVI